VTDTDDLATVLFGLETGTLTTRAVTARITRAVVEWAAARGWSARGEARVGISGPKGERAQRGFVDVIVNRGPAQPDLAIEIDSTDKPWSVAKLRHAVAAGTHAIWIRWGDDAWAGALDDVDVIQLPVTRRPASRVTIATQMSLWP
jgi:hypothetical protein